MALDLINMVRDEHYSSLNMEATCSVHSFFTKWWWNHTYFLYSNHKFVVHRFQAIAFKRQDNDWYYAHFLHKYYKCIATRQHWRIQFFFNFPSIVPAFILKWSLGLCSKHIISWSTRITFVSIIVLYPYIVI